MLYLILAIVCVVFATIIVFAFFDIGINYSFKEAIKAKYSIPVLIIGVLCIICSIFLYKKHVQLVQSDAIDHYVVGDVELHEKTIDGEVVDWTYVVIPADYE